MRIQLAHGTAVVERMPGYGWYLTSIFVEREYRQKGIGTKLMKKVLDKCGRPIYLMATGELGGDVRLLKEFYGRFGFVDYRQKNSDGLPYNANMVLF